MDSMARAVGHGVGAGCVRRVVAALAIAIWAAGPAAARELLFEARPAWVDAVAVPVEAQAAPGSSSGGVEYLLSDRQTRLEAHDRVVYNHFAMRAVSGDGVEEAAHVKISFDPSYETLTLHSIKVHRGGRVFSRLVPARVELLQREKDLEARIYDGRKTANAMLEDVRIGDVVEYDYTVRGVNPAFRDRGAGGYDLQWRVPLQSMYARLTVPEGRDVRLLPRNTALRPEVRHRDGWVDYVWRADKLPALQEDDDAPGWYDAFPIVQWSEYPDWASVAAWALPLYQVAPDQGAELRGQVDAIARASPDPGDRLLATLRFVQREVRYLGIEVGIGSLAPRPPREVLNRRFGDCKDKALLTVWMLRELGIEAQPALVNTRVTRSLDQYQPGPGQFDHVVVHARIGGHHYWFDPTRAEQKGTLANVSQASFGRALVVDPTTTALALMPDTASVVRHHDVRTVFDASGGPGKPMGMQVTTVYEGESAEFMRGEIAGQSHDDLQRRYLNYYAVYYPDLTLQKPFTVSDDDAGNRLTISEYYTLGDPWKRAEQDKRFEASFDSPEIDSQLRTPQRTVRSGPLALSYPMRITSVTEIRLHKDWNLDIKPATIDDPAFRYSYETSAAGPVVTMTERLEMLADNVPADRIARYTEHVKSARASLGLHLYLPDARGATPGGGANWPVALLAVAMAAGALWLARRIWRYDPAPRPAPDGAPRGLGGWLILPAIGLTIAPLRLLKDLVGMAPAYNASTWADLTVSGGAHYNAWWAPFLLVELGAAIALVALSITLIVLFFGRRSSLPRAFVAFAAASIGFRALDLLAGKVLPNGSDSGDAVEWATLLRDGFSAVLWSWYFLVSRRVAATFVERVRAPAGVAVGAPAAPRETSEPADALPTVP